MSRADLSSALCSCCGVSRSRSVLYTARKSAATALMFADGSGCRCAPAYSVIRKRLILKWSTRLGLPLCDRLRRRQRGGEVLHSPAAPLLEDGDELCEDLLLVRLEVRLDAVELLERVPLRLRDVLWSRTRRTSRRRGPARQQRAGDPNGEKENSADGAAARRASARKLSKRPLGGPSAARLRQVGCEDRLEVRQQREEDAWGDMGRYGEIWGDMGRYGDARRTPGASPRGKRLRRRGARARRGGGARRGARLCDERCGGDVGRYGERWRRGFARRARGA